MHRASPESSPPSSRGALRASAVGFTAGLLLALLTSVGIAGERVTAGSPVVAVLANAVATVAAVVALVLTLRVRATALTAHDDSSRAFFLVGPQLAGAAVGIALVHVALHASVFGASRVLVERPAQYVNDAVAVVALLAVIWGASARRFGLACVAVGAALVTAYAATASSWHLDPMTFRAATVQQFVAAQFVAAAVAVGVFRWLAFDDR